MSGIDQQHREPRVIELTIDQIHGYAGNPRRQANPEYERIKASIRQEGLDQPLVVTQKPGESHYVLLAGGNTRLQALKALYQETGESRFYTIHCLLKPWVEESAVLLAHLRENELRGELPFIDKALAVYEAKRLFEQELQVQDLSLRRLEQLLKQHGFPLGNAVISKMGYAVHRLLPLIPQALEAGLGRPQVEKIRALERAGGQYWVEREVGNEAEFADIFATLCRRYDTPDWTVEPLRNALENEIADATQAPLQMIRLTLGALLNGGEIPAYIPDPSEAAATTADTPDAASDCDPPRVECLAPQGTGSKGTDLPDGQVTPESPTTNPPRTAVDPLGPLRQSAFDSAAKLAQRHGLGDRIIPLTDQGIGFLIIEVPDPALKETLDPDLLGQVSMVWWQLAACAEITVAPLDYLIPHLESDSVLYRALVNQDAALLFDRVWTLDPGQIGHQLWRQLTDADWQTLLALMKTYRQLHHEAMMSGHPLWT